MADIDTYTQAYRMLQDQKSQRRAGGVEGRVLTNLAFYFGEHSARHKMGALRIPELNPNRVHLVFNFVRRRVNKLLGRFMSAQGTFRGFPTKKDPAAIAKAEVYTKMIRALDQKLDQIQRSWEIWWWMMMGGVAFEHIPWVPDAVIEPGPKMSESGEQLYLYRETGEELPESMVLQLVEQNKIPIEMFQPLEEGQIQGDVGSTVYGPLNVFVDHGVRSLQQLAPDQYVFIAETKSLEWVKAQPQFENLDKIQPMREIDIVKSQFMHEGDALSNVNLRDMMPVISGELGEGQEAVVFVTGYSPPSRQNPRGKFCLFVPGQAVLIEDPLPYTDLEIPIIDYHWSPVTSSFWTDDYVTDLIVPNKFINKRFSQLAEYANAFVMSPGLLGPGLTPDQIPTDEPGWVENGLSDEGQPLVGRVQPAQIGGWFTQSLNDIMKIINELSGGADIFQESKFPGQLRGPLAVPMLQEILDTEWGPLFLHVGHQMARAKKMRMNRVKQFYPAQRTMHYTGMDYRDEVFEFHTDQILRSDVEYNVSVDPDTLIPELKSMREARVRERVQSPLAVMYMDPRTGRLDRSKIAADLHWGEDEGRDEREAQYRKLAREFIGRIMRGEQVQIVLPFWDHHAMMDEYEAKMATTEFLESSPAVQSALLDLYEKHRKYLAEQQQRMQDAMMSKQVENAVAQATQQAAARAAAETADATLDAVRAQVASQVQNPTPPEVLAMMATSARRGAGGGIPGPRPAGGTGGAPGGAPGGTGGPVPGV